MENTQPVLDTRLRNGLILTLFSFFIYLLPTIIGIKDDDFNTFGFFVFNYVAAFTFIIIAWRAKLWDKVFITLTLFLISAYSLNRSIAIFEPSVPWLKIVLAVCGANYISLSFFDRLPKGLQYVQLAVMGVSLALFLYLSIYLSPVYPIGAIAAIALGISLHAFVPLLFAIFTLIKTIKISRISLRYLWAIGAGFLLSVSVTAIFAIQYGQVNKWVAKCYRHAMMADNTDLPPWVKIAQRIPDNWVTEKYLKGNLVYTMPGRDFFDFGWSTRRINLGEGRMHDPMLVAAATLHPTPEISLEERMKVLEAIYISGHKAQEELWNGRELVTTGVTTNVRIWPRQRISYTEKTITVSNTTSRDWFGLGEGLYTFHMPEGAVVTSLSLWIDGVEQKGVLTTKHKADSAYRQIVGVERHDPSVVHWQEGNTVLVRVFPVPENGTRNFKIGITAPLTVAEGNIIYENIWFEGPTFFNAKETRQINWVDEPADLKMESGYERNAPHRYIMDTKYQPYWSLSFKAMPLEPATFTFDHYRYTLKPHTKVRVPATIDRIYLDVNDRWTPGEVEQILKIAGNKKVYVFNEEMQKIAPGVAEGTSFCKPLMSYRFSLFPFQSVHDPATALVITKGTHFSPPLKALAHTPFADSLALKMLTSPAIKLFNIGSTLTPYLKTLKEHRIFLYEQGSLDDLAKLLTSSTFTGPEEDSNHIVVDNAQLEIARTADTSTVANGIDHIMRLFAYNHMMSRLKGDLFPSDYPDTTLVTEAQKAYIVSPVSSLIVLETQKDYDRFNIAGSKTSLGNASIKGSGAVPEPHEWALIIIAILALAGLLFKEKLRALLRWS